MRYLPVLCALLFSGAAESATRYVDPAHPKSTNSGAGTATAPYKTISHAMRQLVSGDRLVIAAGTYRETLTPKWRASNLIIEGTPGTVIKGSDVVTGWTSYGRGIFVRRGWGVNSQQVFVNGQAYQQIGGSIAQPYASHWPGRVSGGVSSMTPNSFYYDGRNLYIKPADGSISGKLIEASVRQRIANGASLSNVQVSNLTFMHSNTSATVEGAAVRFEGNRLKLNRVTVLRADLVCLAVVGDNNEVTNSVANYCGSIGMNIRGRYNKILNSETSFNNTRGFDPDFGAGGMKCIGPGGTAPGGLQDSVISGHKALYNKGEGIWLDTNPGGGNHIRDSIAAYNTRYGIHFEISRGVQIYNNLVFGNGSRGIYVAGSSDAVVSHNLSVANGIDNISVSNSRNSTGSYRPNWLPRNNKVVGNLVAWPQSGALRIPDKSFNPVSNGNLFVDDQPSRFAQERTGSYAARATGISPWQSLSAQDRSSWEKTMPIASAISAALKAQQANVDWSSLQNLVANLRSSTVPGPLSYNIGETVTSVADAAPASPVAHAVEAQPEPQVAAEAPSPDTSAAPADDSSPKRKKHVALK